MEIVGLCDTCMVHFLSMRFLDEKSLDSSIPHRTVPSEATVLIQGESGTGKELIAKAIHGCSNRSIKHNGWITPGGNRERSDIQTLRKTSGNKSEAANF